MLMYVIPDLTIRSRTWGLTLGVGSTIPLNCRESPEKFYITRQQKHGDQQTYTKIGQLIRSIGLAC
jgi:hypothetical protein